MNFSSFPKLHILSKHLKEEGNKFWNDFTLFNKFSILGKLNKFMYLSTTDSQHFFSQVKKLFSPFCPLVFAINEKYTIWELKIERNEFNRCSKPWQKLWKRKQSIIVIFIDYLNLRSYVSCQKFSLFKFPYNFMYVASPGWWSLFSWIHH